MVEQKPSKKIAKKKPTQTKIKKKIRKVNASIKKKPIQKKATKIKKVRKNSKKNQENFFKNQKVILILAASLLLVLTFSSYFLLKEKSKEERKVQGKISIEEQNELPQVKIYNGTVELLVFYDKFTDEIIEEQKIEPIIITFQNYFQQDLNYKMIDINEKKNQEEYSNYIEKINTVPMLFFSQNIDERGDWQQMSQSFQPIKVNGENFYISDPGSPIRKILKEIDFSNINPITIGNEDAKVTLKTFFDYECEFCALVEGNNEMLQLVRAQIPDYTSPMPNIIKEYVETGLINIEYINLPIEQVHPQVKPVHLAALCANEQNQFEKYSNNLWEDRATWAKLILETERIGMLKKYAKDLNLNTKQFNTCLDTKKYENELDNQVKLSSSILMATPFFIVEDIFLPGAQDYKIMKKVLDAKLNE